MTRCSFSFSCVAALTLSVFGCGARSPAVHTPDASAPIPMPQGAGTKRALVLVEGPGPTPTRTRADVAPEEDLSTARILRKVLTAERP